MVISTETGCVKVGLGKLIRAGASLTNAPQVQATAISPRWIELLYSEVTVTLLASTGHTMASHMPIMQAFSPDLGTGIPGARAQRTRHRQG